MRLKDSGEICLVPECGRRRVWEEGWCTTHGKRKRCGDPAWNRPLKRYYPREGSCSVTGCVAKRFRSAICQTHYNRKHKAKLPNWDAAINPYRPIGTSGVFIGLRMEKSAASWLKAACYARGISQYKLAAEILQIWAEKTSKDGKLKPKQYFDEIRAEDFVRRGQAIEDA